MKKRKLFWQFFGVHILILFVTVSFVTLYTWLTTRDVFHRQWVRELETQAQLAAALLPHGDGTVDDAAIARFIERLGAVGDDRFTLILPDGRVIGDSAADAAHMDSHRDRPEVREALAKGRGTSQRYSASVGKQMLYLAQRVPPEGPAQAVVRVSVPVRTLTRELEGIDRMLVILLVVVLMATFALSYGAALRIVGPVSKLQNGLTRIGGGEIRPASPRLA